MDQYLPLKQEIKRERIKGVIFDFDGVIVKLDVDWQGLREELKDAFSLKDVVWMSEILEKIKTIKGNKGLKEAYKTIRKYELKNFDNHNLIKKTVPIIGKIKKSGKRVGIFSNNMRTTIDLCLDQFKLNSLIDTVVSKEDVESTKPDPEGFYKILDNWQLSKDEVIFVGYSEFDMLCGKNAKIKTVLI